MREIAINGNDKFVPLICMPEKKLTAKARGYNVTGGPP